MCLSLGGERAEINFPHVCQNGEFWICMLHLHSMPSMSSYSPGFPALLWDQPEGADLNGLRTRLERFRLHVCPGLTPGLDNVWKYRWASLPLIVVTYYYTWWISRTVCQVIIFMVFRTFLNKTLYFLIIWPKMLIINYEYM